MFPGRKTPTTTCIHRMLITDESNNTSTPPQPLSAQRLCIFSNLSVIISPVFNNLDSQVRNIHKPSAVKVIISKLINNLTLWVGGHGGVMIDWNLLFRFVEIFDT